MKKITKWNIGKSHRFSLRNEERIFLFSFFLIFFPPLTHFFHSLLLLVVVGGWMGIFLWCESECDWWIFIVMFCDLFWCMEIPEATKMRKLMKISRNMRKDIIKDFECRRALHWLHSFGCSGLFMARNFPLVVVVRTLLLLVEKEKKKKVKTKNQWRGKKSFY